MKTDRAAGLALDPGVLSEGPVLELYGWGAVEAHGGLAVLPRRDAWLEAMGAGVESVGLPSRVSETFPQAIVHLQKGRAATESGLAAAWERLEIGGRLVLIGGNDLGVKSAVRRLAGELGQPGRVVANRARARAVVFERKAGVELTRPEAPDVEVEFSGRTLSLRGAIGVFSAGRVDRGTRLLLDEIERFDRPVETVLDMGCGLGVLGFAALTRRQEARAVLADIDRRAVEVAAENAAMLGFSDRCRTAWWDARLEGPPATGCDLAVINPPFHTAKAVDLDPARAMFRTLDRALGPDGVALVVANRTLPYERDLGLIGRVRVLRQVEGFKILEMRRG